MTPLDYRFSMTADDVKSATECGPATRGLSRRSVVRTAAHAAWAVPVVQLAASAPAFADSTLPGIENPTYTFSRGGSNTWTAAGFTVSNDGPGPLDAGKIQFTAIATDGTWSQNSAASPWVYVSGAGTGTIIYSYNAQVPVGTNLSLNGPIVINKSNNKGDPTSSLTYQA